MIIIYNKKEMQNLCDNYFEKKDRYTIIYKRTTKKCYNYL